jgi:hypothetical protein
MPRQSKPQAPKVPEQPPSFFRVRATELAGNRVAVWDRENAAGEVFIAKGTGDTVVAMSEKVANALAARVIERVPDDETEQEEKEP